MTDLADGPALRVVHWRRYGQHRIYVNAPDGTRVGWVDQRTGETTLEVEDLRADFELAIAAHATQTAEAPVVPEPVDAAPAPDPQPALERPWTDLALNRPGEGVAVEARRAFVEAPVRNLAARALGVHTNERAWRLGAKGEALVGKQLTKLDPTWKALHSVPVGSRGSDIDHVVVGPGGVYTINTKNHPQKSVWVSGNTFTVDRVRQPYIRNARHEAERAQRVLSGAVGFDVPVVGLIAVIGAHEGFTVKAQPRDGRVIVLTRRELAQWLGRRGPVLDAAQVDDIFGVARRSTTWT